MASNCSSGDATKKSKSSLQEHNYNKNYKNKSLRNKSNDKSGETSNGNGSKGNEKPRNGPDKSSGSSSSDEGENFFISIYIFYHLKFFRSKLEISTTTARFYFRILRSVSELFRKWPL